MKNNPTSFVPSAQKTFRIVAPDFDRRSSDILPTKVYKEFYARERIRRVEVKRYADGAVIVDIRYEEQPTSPQDTLSHQGGEDGKCECHCHRGKSSYNHFYDKDGEDICPVQSCEHGQPSPAAEPKQHDCDCHDNMNGLCNSLCLDCNPSPLELGQVGETMEQRFAKEWGNIQDSEGYYYDQILDFIKLELARQLQEVHKQYLRLSHPEFQEWLVDHLDQKQAVDNE